MERRRFFRWLVCDLSDDEVAKMAEEASQADKERGELEADEEKAKANAKACKEEAAAKDRIARARLHCVRTRQESREVECEESYDHETDKMIVVRLDTGAIIDTRVLREEERQGELRMLPRERTPEEQDQLDREPAGS